MSAKHCCRVKISRLRFKATTLPVLLLALIVLTQCIAGTQASADYGEPDDFQLNSGSASEAVSNNDDIYEHVLQQEVEASEQKTRVEHMEAEAEQAIKDVNNISANHISNEYMSLEHENMTEEEVAQNEEERGPSEEYEDSSSMNILTTPKTIRLPTSPTTTTTTSMIPEYVRKAKAEHFRPTMMTSEDEVESNISLSDYIEDEGVHASHQTTKKSSTMTNDSPHHNSNEDKVDDIVPFAMKFYQNDDDDEDTQEGNKIKELEGLTPQSLPQQQLLPNLQQAQHFHQQTSSEEEYNEDSRGESIEHNLRGSGKTTSTPHNPSTSFPTNQSNNIAISRASIPGFPVKFSGSWTTNAPLPPPPPTTPTTATSATTVAPTTTTTTTGLSESSTATAAAPTITTLRPAGKQAKQINISRRKLQPHEQLRNYVEDAYIRMPLAVIVDPSAESLEKTKALWRDALRTNLNIKIVLVSLNASGIPAAYNFNNTRQFLAGLNSIKEHAGGNAFIGIVHASELVPYDSAVFISTASIPRHTELVQDAAITLLKKRIRLYLIWYGERAISENETQEAVGGILGEVAIRSGGEILHIVGSENSQELEGNTLTLVADAFRGSQEVEIPVDTTLSSLHVKIDAPMRTATLETPNGDINLKKLVKFKSRILTFGGDDKRLDAYVPLTKLRKATVFKLKMVPESLDQEYIVFVRADRKADQFLDDMIKRFDSYFMEGLTAYPTKFRDSRLQSITAALAAATQPTHDNLRFPDPNEKSEEMDSAPKTEVETFSEIEVHKSTNSGNNSVMADVTAVGNQRATNVLQRDVTKIEMGVQSQVLVAPGMMAQLHFEVTNTRSEPILHNIQVIDERRFLLRLAPQSVFLRAGEMSTVSVTVLVPAGTPEGTIDRITFTCHGGGGSTISLNLRVITTVDAQDTTAPSISWYFGNRCDSIASDSSSCAERFWTLDITAQDWQTGILRLMSTPSGLIYRNSYTIGSTDPMKATYIATCCEPKVALTAYDIAGNQRSYNIDVRDIWLTEASIAAIVLGALLLILLIVLLIVGIVWCCRRRKVSLDLPTYRSHSTRSME